jgi:hypothetical protein
MKFNIYNLLAVLLIVPFFASAQTGGVRGTVLDKESGEPLMFTPVFLNDGLKYNTQTQDDGFFTIASVPPGKYILQCRAIGYDSIGIEIEVESGKMLNYNLSLVASGLKTGPVEVTANREEAQTETKVSVVRITAKDIQRLPSAGGEADFAQYLQVIPGIVFTGDQGGQIYIRGGAPVQNKILLDGMTIFNAFHSIGFFSVFETEAIRSVDVYTGGFSSKYGGRSSAIVDIRTREGDKKRFGGLVSINPFVGKFLFEGPIIKLDETKGRSLSFMVTGKHSYLNYTSDWFYKPILERPRTEATNTTLPYSFTDIYAKLSFNTSNGSRLNAFGFSFMDNADFKGVAAYKWNSAGGGLDFRIVPGSAKLIMEGNIGYSTYAANFIEGDNTKERFSKVNNFNTNINFAYYMARNSEINYGIEINSFLTDFSLVNNSSIPYMQKQSNTEVAAYVRYKGLIGKVVIEPSFRAQYYASLGEFRAEPRIAAKYNITDYLRVKVAGGLYSQNLISSVDERDVVNLFVGFLGSPDEQVFRITGFDSTKKVPIYAPTKSRLQTSVHAVGGFEVNVGKNININIEPYWKWFPQIVSLNRNRTATALTDAFGNKTYEPEFIADNGQAYGLDLNATYEKNQLYIYLAYSLGFVTRNDGLQDYYASFDRRHNMNLVTSYKFRIGKLKEMSEEERKYKTEHPFEASLRWNLGSGFPFTATQGFYSQFNFQDGINTDYISQNNNPGVELGVIYSDQINNKRLPYYHRLDLSLKYTVDFSKHTKLMINLSLTNAYDRPNIFYFDRVRYRRVNQLPILPALGVILKF